VLDSLWAWPVAFAILFPTSDFSACPCQESVSHSPGGISSASTPPRPYCTRGFSPSDFQNPGVLSSWSLSLDVPPVDENLNMCKSFQAGRIGTTLPVLKPPPVFHEILHLISFRIQPDRGHPEKLEIFFSSPRAVALVFLLPGPSHSSRPGTDLSIASEAQALF